MQHSNRLTDETSPYLLQHAHNPVDWYPWGEAALQKARNENKPILVSIGYSACHWCHVMEKESFEDEVTAAVMNENFVNIKIDREERPDLDHIYMDAVQTMTGSGGWPLNVFLTPDSKPFYGGTYFPPESAYNRPSWKEVLLGVAHAYRNKNHEIVSQAENLTAHLLQSNQFGVNAFSAEAVFNKEQPAAMVENLMKSADKKDGGFGDAPKFPQTFSIQYLLRHFHFYKDIPALQHACLSLDKMIYGGIYDQLSGGFARYATDSAWLVPHFEKMLYDNALLLTVISEAYQVTGKDQYRRVIEQTMDFIETTWLSPEGGFYSALDADSEGVEGKYYVWQKEEITSLLGEDAALFCAYYDVTEEGNWEGSAILHVPIAPEIFCKQHSITPEELHSRLEASRQKLLQYRNERIPPALDDKQLLGWNALMNTACSKAFAATGHEKYRQLAIGNMRFIMNHFSDKNQFFHTYKNGVAKYPAFLDDYSCLIQALIHLQEITANPDYLLQARKITENVLEGFTEKESGFFYFTHSQQKDVIIRKKEVYDGAVPSGNSVMAGNLRYLSIVFDNREWKERANLITGSLASAIVKYPSSFGNWANELLIMIMGNKELVVTGENFNDIHLDILHNFMPGKILQLSTVPLEDFPLLTGKRYNNPPLIYFCENYECKAPVKSLSELIQLLEN